MYTTLHLLGFEIPTFTVLFIMGAFVGNWFFARAMRAELRANERQLAIAQILLVAVFFAGGWLGNVVLYDAFLPFTQGGYSIMGSVLFLVLALPLIARAINFGNDWKRFADIVAVSFFPTQIIGKIGCFAAGCCFGAESDSIFSVVFPRYSPAPSGIHLHAVQLYEAAGLTLLWILCRRLHRSNRVPGMILAVVLIGKGLERFLVEFVRGDVVMTGLGLSTAQVASIVFIVAGLVFMRVSVGRSVRQSAAFEPVVLPEDSL